MYLLKRLGLGALYIGLGFCLLNSTAESSYGELPQISFDFSPYSVTHSEPHKTQLRHRSLPFKVTRAQIICLAQNIYYEASGESTQGKIAVGLVTINRSELHRRNVCKVVHRWSLVKGQRICQFSWVCSTSRQKVVERVYRECIKIATRLLTYKTPDITHGADHYHADYVKPYWARGKTPVASIGAHIFYKLN